MKSVLRNIAAAGIVIVLFVLYFTFRYISFAPLLIGGASGGLFIFIISLIKGMKKTHS